MSTSPYLPAGQNELPAERYIIFAGTDNAVKIFDESVKTADGITFSGRWMSPSLNREDSFGEYTLTMVSLAYSAEADTTITIQASGDGGVTWRESKQAVIRATAGSRTRWHTVSFATTGADVRFQITFHTNVLVNIFGYRPVLVRRGQAEYGG